MRNSVSVHRLTNGSIDFDHYRRIATDARTETVRRTLRGAADSLGKAAAAGLARLRRLTSLPVSQRVAPSR